MSSAVTTRSIDRQCGVAYCAAMVRPATAAGYFPAVSSRYRKVSHLTGW